MPFHFSRSASEADCQLTDNHRRETLFGARRQSAMEEARPDQ